MITALVFAATLGFGTSAAFSQTVADAIVAVVNDDVITLKDLKDYVRALMIQLKMEGNSDRQLASLMKDLEANGLQRLINDHLILSEANRIGLEVRPEVVNQRLDEIRHSYKSEQDFLDALIAEGATISDLKKKFEDQFKIQYMIENEVKSRVTVNPQEVTEYYKAHFERFQKPQAVELLSIIILKNDDREQALSRANDILKQAESGRDFQVLADKYSEGPPIGTIERGKTVPEIEDAVFSLKAGELTEIISLSDGYYILKVIKPIPSYIAPLEQVKEDITKELYQTKFKLQFDEWIDNLANKAYIEIKK